MFDRPTFQQIINRTEADFKAALGITSLLRRSVISALSRVVAATAHNLHSQLDYTSRQLFPDQADAENLARYASIYGIARREAVFTELSADFIFTGVATVPAGAVLKRVDDAEFVVKTTTTSIGAQTLSIAIEASEAGSFYNTPNSSVFVLESPIVGVENDAVINSTVVEGSDVEDDESLRSRLLSRIQSPPSGGTIDDYKKFALEVADIGRVWVLTDFGEPFFVGITALSTDGTNPSPAKIEELKSNIDLQKPVTAKTIVFAPDVQSVDIEIAINPNTLAVRNEVESELVDLFAREAQVRGAYAGVDVPVYTGRIPISKISEAISISAGENNHTIVSPTLDPVPAERGTILKLGTLTFTTLVV